MTNLLPLLYLTILLLSLCVLAFFLFTQIIRKKETETEFSILQKKLQSNEMNYFDHYSLGVIYVSKKLFDQAIVQFSYALKTWDKTDPNGLANLYNTIGFTYFQTEQFELAIYYYKEALNLVPEYIISLNNLAYAYEKKKLFLDALQTYEKVLEYDEINPIANEKLILLRRRIKNRDDRI
jgi:tetratricopeptide (TPR) repeat protein